MKIGMKKWLTALAAALMAMALAIPGIPVRAAAAENPKTPEYLRSAQEDILKEKLRNEGTERLLTGSLLDGAGSGDSDWYALGAARMGILPVSDRAAYLYRLQETVTDIYSDLEENTRNLKASDWYRIILTATALGGDAENLGTDPDGNPINLVNDGIWNCILGDPGSQGINGYTWALLAVDCGGYQEPEAADWTRKKLIGAILSRQQADGGYALMKGKSDSDLTAMALQALAPYREDETVYTVENLYTKETRKVTVSQVGEEAFTVLAEMQDGDGAMETVGEPTSESTVQTLAALAAWGRNPEEDPVFQKEGKTLLDGLFSFRKEDGSFAHCRNDADAELMSLNMPNYQALYGLESCIRVMEGKNSLYNMKDAEPVSEEAVKEAGAKLPERQTETEKSGAEIRQETESRSSRMGLFLTIAAVVLFLVLLVILLRGRKKKRQEKQDSWNDEEEW